MNSKRGRSASTGAGGKNKNDKNGRVPIKHKWDNKFKDEIVDYFEGN